MVALGELMVSGFSGIGCSEKRMDLAVGSSACSSPVASGVLHAVASALNFENVTTVGEAVQGGACYEIPS